MTDNDIEPTTENKINGAIQNESLSPRPSEEPDLHMSASMSELIINTNQNGTSEMTQNDSPAQHKLSVASSVNGGLEDTNVVQKQSATAKLELQSKEKLIQLIRKQLVIIKEARKVAAESKNEVESLRQQISASSESKTQRNVESMLSLELSDYKKGMETLRKKCESADKELSEKDGIMKELSMKLHNLTEQNAELKDTEFRQKNEITALSSKISELENSQRELREELERQQVDFQSRLEAATGDEEKNLDIIKKLRSELKNIRNEGVDHKTELSQLQKSKHILQKNYDDLAAEFSTYKEKAEFVLKQHNTEKQKVTENFEIEELQRQLKNKHEQINQLSDRNLGLQQEVASATERCRVLRSELEDHRQSMHISQKGVAEERRRIASEYEQRIRQLSKELEGSKRDYQLIQEQAVTETQKLEETNSKFVSELNTQIQNLQYKLSQLADKNVNSVQDNKQKSIEREQKRTAFVNPINFDTETRFNVQEIGQSNNANKDDMLNSLNDLINGVEPTQETDLNFVTQRSRSQGSLNSWADPEDLEVQLQHTRSILREAEQTNAKLEAQVDLLKKELRRNESNNVSVQHINENMGYFKDVMLKFLAPEKKDMRVQMLPVLATMLALSPDEMKSVENALKAQQEERGVAASEFSGYFGPLSGIF